MNMLSNYKTQIREFCYYKSIPIKLHQMDETTS